MPVLRILRDASVEDAGHVAGAALACFNVFAMFFMVAWCAIMLLLWFDKDGAMSNTACSDKCTYTTALGMQRQQSPHRYRMSRVTAIIYDSNSQWHPGSFLLQLSSRECIRQFLFCSSAAAVGESDPKVTSSMRMVSGGTPSCSAKRHRCCNCFKSSKKTDMLKL